TMKVVEARYAWAGDGEDWFAQYLQEFYAGRNLMRVSAWAEIIPWLEKLRFGSRKWEKASMMRPPHADHYNYFIDRGTGERIVTIQPYFLDGICERFEPESITPAVQEKLNRVTDESEQFAKQYGLTVKVSPKSWYY